MSFSCKNGLLFLSLNNNFILEICIIIYKKETSIVIRDYGTYLSKYFFCWSKLLKMFFRFKITKNNRSDKQGIIQLNVKNYKNVFKSFQL